jgi:chromosome segregation ATPase
MQEIQQLNSKLEELFARYTALQTENKSLKASVSNHLQTIESLNGKLSASEQMVRDAEANKTVFVQSEREVMRKEIDTVIGEIDKILNTLDE